MALVGTIAESLRRDPWATPADGEWGSLGAGWIASLGAECLDGTEPELWLLQSQLDPADVDSEGSGLRLGNEWQRLLLRSVTTTPAMMALILLTAENREVMASSAETARHSAGGLARGARRA